jgi:hypothetical protein
MSLEDQLRTLLAKQSIAEVVQRWGRARDQGLWDDLAATFHPGGRIKVMWFEGTHVDFIAECTKRFAHGTGSTKHFIAVSLITVRGAKALSETPAMLSMSGELAGANFLGQSFLRFQDRFEERGGEWRIVQRTAIYEGDRFITDRPVELDEKLLKTYKAPFRYLAYRQHLQGLDIDPKTPLDGTAELEALNRDAKAWLG